MSEENLPDPVESGESPPERKFSQEHYDRLMKGQEPWLKFSNEWEGKRDAWDVFQEDQPQKVAAMREAIREWNIDLPQGACLQGAYLREAHLEGAELLWAYLEGANLEGAHLEGANLMGAHLEGTDLIWAHLEGANLSNAHLEGAVLAWAHLEGADLDEAHLERADLRGAHLAKAEFRRTAISGETGLALIEFGPEHKVMHDGSDSLQLPARDRYLTWGHLRSIGTLPLFGASYAVLGGTLAMINGLDFLNEHFDWTLSHRLGQCG